MQTDSWRRELTIAVAAFGFGFLFLPLAVYWLGTQVLGEYSPGKGVLDLAESVWLDFLRLSPPAWVLVLSPYLLIQGLRVLRRLWKGANPVNTVTNPHDRP